MLLSLDINSARTGYAFGGPSDGAPRVGVWHLPGGEDLPRAAAGLYNAICELSKLLHPKIVIIEAPLQMGNRSARTALVLIALYGAACAAGNNAGARVIPAHVATWRKHFVDKGYPQDAKDAVAERCRVLGWSVDNHDEADAAGLWSWGMATNYRQWAPRSTPMFAAGAA